MSVTMLRVMLVDKNRGRGALLQQALEDAGYDVVTVIHSSHTLFDTLQSLDVDVILIDLASPDRDTLENLGALKETHPKPVVMLSEDNSQKMISAAIHAGVSAYVVDSLSQVRIQSILEVAIARFREYEAMRKALQKAETQLVERKSIERAKGILMQQKSMNEEQAYHCLRKMAMDKHMKIADIAEHVISISKLLI